MVASFQHSAAAVNFSRIKSPVLVLWAAPVSVKVVVAWSVTLLFCELLLRLSCSGLRYTDVIGFQLRVSLLHRSGLRFASLCIHAMPFCEDFYFTASVTIFRRYKTNSAVPVFGVVPPDK